MMQRTNTESFFLEQAKKPLFDINEFYDKTAKSFSIPGKHVNDEAIKECIAPWLTQHSEITTLNFNNNVISDEGAKEIAALLQKNSSIIALNLQNNKISSEGVDALIRALSTITDRSIELDLTLNLEISEKGSRQLQDFATRSGSTNNHTVLFSPCVVPASDCPRLDELARKALISLGLHNIYNNGVVIQEDASEAYRNRAAALLEQTVFDAEVSILLQAVVDDDIAKVKEILNQNPALLLAKSSTPLMIESKLTWQCFDVSLENALSIAVKRKQITMIESLLPYIKQLDQSKDKLGNQPDFDEAMQVLSQWSSSVMHQNKFVIPEEYVRYAKSLIDVFTRETFPNGDDNITNLSADTENAMNYLFNSMLLHKKPVKLDNYLDVELFLLAVLKAYVVHFGQFQNVEQRNAFCIRVIGLIQSVLSPEIAKIFCQGFYLISPVLDQGKAITEISISDKAKEHKLKGDDTSFYRASRDSHLGLGSEFFCGFYGCGKAILQCKLGAVNLQSMEPGLLLWENYVKYKQQFFGALRSNCSNNQSSSICNRKS
jgi:hypothetical protein